MPPNARVAVPRRSARGTFAPAGSMSQPSLRPWSWQPPWPPPAASVSPAAGEGSRRRTPRRRVAFRLEGPNDAALVVPVCRRHRPVRLRLAELDPHVRRSDLATRLGLEEQPVGPGVGIGAGGAERLSVTRSTPCGSGALVTDVLACVVDLRRRFGLGCGLVGLNFMKPFTITIDFDRGHPHRQPDTALRSARCRPPRPSGAQGVGVRAWVAPTRLTPRA